MHLGRFKISAQQKLQKNISPVLLIEEFSEIFRIITVSFMAQGSL